MARIRTIKPEFPHSESIGKLSRDGRLLFIQLWTLVDDEGRARAASRMLASLLYPYDDDAPKLIDVWLDELERNELVRIYDVQGARYLEVTNWLKHQKIDKPSKSRLPAYDASVAKPREASRSLATDLGPRTSTKDHSEATASAAPVYSDSKHELWGEGAAILQQLGLTEKAAKSNIGRWLRDSKDDSVAVLGAIQRARDHRVIDPIPWITRAIKSGSNNAAIKNHPGGSWGASLDEWREARAELRANIEANERDAGGGLAIEILPTAGRG